MNWKWFKILARRFTKAFLAGGLAGLTVHLANSPTQTFSNLTELKTWSFTLVYAFIVGGLMAIEKARQGYQPSK